MLICINMMTTSEIETGLAHRLERLTGTDASCCLPRYQGLGKQVAKGGRFAKALARARALADEQRLTAVALLRQEGELCACEIQAALGVTHATVSHHMSVLASSGIVSARRRGKWMYYRLRPESLKEVL